MSENVYQQQFKASPFDSVKHEPVSTKAEGEDEGRVKPRIYEIIPGRVELISAGSSPADDAATRARIEKEFGLRLLGLDEVIANRNRTQLGPDGGGLPLSESLGR